MTASVDIGPGDTSGSPLDQTAPRADTHLDAVAQGQRVDREVAG